MAAPYRSPAEDAAWLAAQTRDALGIGEAQRHHVAVAVVVGGCVAVWQLLVFARRIRTRRCTPFQAWLALVVAVTGVGLFIADAGRCRPGAGALKLLALLLLVYVLSPCTLPYDADDETADDDDA